MKNEEWRNAKFVIIGWSVSEIITDKLHDRRFLYVDIVDIKIKLSINKRHGIWIM